MNRKKSSLFCKIGIHEWGKATFISHAVRSNILDWKQTCRFCGKRKTWITAKGLTEIYYPGKGRDIPLKSQHEQNLTLEQKILLLIALGFFGFLIILLLPKLL